MKTETADALLKVIRDSRARHPELAEQAGPLNEAQALRDCAGILARLPRAIEWARRPGQGRGNRRNVGALRVLAAMAAEDFYRHTGKDFGSTTAKKTKRKGGLFPEFIKLLAEQHGLTLEKRTLYGACREAKDALTAQYYAFHPTERLEIVPRIGPDHPGDGESIEKTDAITRRGRAIPKLAAKRATLLRPHVVAYVNDQGEEDPDGDPWMGGYEPAQDRTEAASEIFAKAIRNRRGKPSKSR